MLTITEEKTLYTFDELNQHGKETAAHAFFEFYFYDYVMEELEFYNDEHFSNSSPRWNWAFNSCQGDGVNLYGNIAYNDLAKLANLPEPVYMRDVTIECAPNRHYSYCTWGKSSDQCLDIYYTLHYEHDVPEKIALEWARAICAAVENLCSIINRWGNDLVMDVYENGDYYESQLFDESGHFECYEWDRPEEPEPLPAVDPVITSNQMEYDTRTANDIYNRLINSAALYLESAYQTRNPETRKMTESNYVAIIDVLDRLTCFEVSELHRDAQQIVKEWDGVTPEMQYFAITPWNTVDEL